MLIKNQNIQVETIMTFIKRCRKYSVLIAVMMVATLASSGANAGFGNDGASCKKKDTWEWAHWESYDYPWAQSNGMSWKKKAYVKYKSRYPLGSSIPTKTWGANDQLFDVTYYSSFYDAQCVGGCGSDCNAKWGGLDCLEHDMCLTAAYDAKNGKNDASCGDEYKHAINNFANALNAISLAICVKRWNRG
jgi:hypothetical protein